MSLFIKWRQKFAVTLCVCMIVTLIPYTLGGSISEAAVETQVETQSQRLIDSFADGDANGWSLQSNTWGVHEMVDGPMGSPSFVLSQNMNSVATEYALIGDGSWKDYHAELKLRLSNMSVGGSGAVVFRFQDDRNFYMFRFNNSNNGRIVQLQKRVNGTVTSLASSPYTWEDETWYDVQISIAGSNIEVSIDGQIVIVHAGNPEELQTGKLGLRSYFTEMQLDRIEANGELVRPVQAMNLSSTLASNGVELSWSASLEPEASSYKVFRGEVNPEVEEVEYMTISESVYGTSFLDTDVIHDQSYNYYIEAADMEGLSFVRSEEISLRYEGEVDRGARFIDSYADGDANGWSLQSNTWGVQEMAVGSDGSPSYVLSQNRNSVTTEYALIGDETWRDYLVDMKLRLSNMSVGGSGAVVFRFQDDRNFYMFRFNNSNNGRIVQLQKRVNGTVTSLASSPYTWEDETWYDVQISIAGSNIEVSIDGQSVIVHAGNPEELQTGKVGLRSYYTEMQLDRIEANGELSQPAQAMGLSTSIASSGVELSWNPSLEPEAGSYRLYRGESNPASEQIEYAVLIDSLAATSYTDTSIEGGKSYYYYIEVKDSSGKPFARSTHVKATPLEGTTLATLEDEKLRMEFFETDIEGQTVIAKRVFLSKNGSWELLPTSPADEKYAVIYSSEVALGKQQFQQDNDQTHPVWTTSEVSNEPNIFDIGTVHWVRPTDIEVIGEQVILRASNSSEFTVEWTWELPADGGWPRVEQRLEVQTEGYWTMVSQQMFEKQAADINGIQLGFLISGKRVPDQPYVVPEYQLPNPAALVEMTTANLGQLTFGLVPAAEEIPIRMAKLNNSRFGLLISTEEGGVQPGLTAPLWGTEESYLIPNDSYTFQYHYVIEEAGWWDTYEKIATDIFGFHDYRKSGQTSLTDAIHNMTDLIMDETYSGWWDLAKGFKNIEKPNSTQHSNSTAAMQAFLLSGNEEIYRKRVLPLTEFLLSRNQSGFSPITTDIPSGVSADLGGPAYGAATLLPLYELGQRSTGVLYHKAMEEVALGKRTHLIQENLAAYRSTNNSSYLDIARAQADAIVMQVDSVGTTPLSGSAFVYRNFPEFESLLEFYEITGEQKYLIAAEKAARMFMTSIWMQPIPESGAMLTVPGDPIPRSPYVRWTEPEGWPAINEAELQETVEAWIPSQAGLSLEQGTTFEHMGANGPVMNPGWAGYLLRLSDLTDHSFYKDVARSSIVGRYGNYPGYYYKQYGVTQMDPMYPYQGPDITDIYYHHIPVQLGLTVDFLMEELKYRSGQQINFQGEIDPGLGGNLGYLWFKFKAYGHEPGKMFGRTGMQPWLPKGLVDTNTPEVSWVGATDGEQLGISLMSYDDKNLEIVVHIDTEMIESADTRSVVVVDELGTETEASMVNGQITVSIPAKGLRTLFIDGLDLQLPTMQFQGSNLTPEDQESSYIKDETGIPQLGNIAGALIIHNDRDYDAYVYTDTKDDVITEAILHYYDGYEWNKLEKKEYPFEFSVGPIAQEYPFEYILETRTDASEIYYSDLTEIKVTELLTWKQGRVDRQWNHAIEFITGSNFIQNSLTESERTQLMNDVNELALNGQTILTDTADESRDSIDRLLFYQTEYGQLEQWLENRFPQYLDEDIDDLYQALGKIRSMLNHRLNEMIHVGMEVVDPNDLSILQGGTATFTIQWTNHSMINLENGVISLELPEQWQALDPDDSNIIVPMLGPGESINQTWTVKATSGVPAGIHPVPIHYSYDIDGLTTEKKLVLPMKVMSSLRIELLADHPLFLAGEPKQVDITIHNEGLTSVNGQVSLNIPTSWSVLGDLQFTDLAPGSSVMKQLEITAPSHEQARDLVITVIAEDENNAIQQKEWNVKVSRNVALSIFGSAATASSELTVNTGDKTIDGGTTSPTSFRWTSLESGPHSLIIDFGKLREIDRVTIRHFGEMGNPSFNTSDFQIQTSTNMTGPWTDLVEPVEDNTLSTTNHSFPSISIQYIRLYITKGSATDNYARIFQVEAHMAQSPEVPYITSVEEISSRFVNFARTKLDELDLPQTVGVILNDLSSRSIKVNWDQGTPFYNRLSPGMYTFYGALEIPSDILNPNGIQAQMTVEVRRPGGKAKDKQEKARVE